MDSRFVVLVFASVISTVCTVAVNPLQNVETNASEEIDKVPFYPNVPEESEAYFNPSLYGPAAYDYRKMMVHPSRGPFDHSFGSGFPHPMYMDPGMPPKWRAPYSPPYPPPVQSPMAYWLSRLHKAKHPEVPSEPHTTNKTQNETTTSATTTTTTTTVAPELTTEVTTQIAEVETTETPKQQTEEPSEEPKERQLPTKNTGQDCAPDEETTNAPTNANEEQPATTTAAAVPQVTPVNAPSTEVAASSTEAKLPDEEVVPAATLRRNNKLVHPEMALPPMYPGKSLYGPGYPPMPYLPMSMDPYAAYRRMGPHQMFPGIPEGYYGF